MLNIRTKLSFKTESGNVIDKLRVRSIELRKNQKVKNNGNNDNILPKLIPFKPQQFQ